MKEQIQTLRDMLDHFCCPAEDEALDKLETYLDDLKQERDQLATRVKELEHEPDWMADSYCHDKSVGELAMDAFEMASTARRLMRTKP